MEDLRAIIEAMIFSAETPLTVNKMKDVLGDAAEKSDILREIEEIRDEHVNRAGGFTLENVAGGYQFRTRSDLASWVRRVRGVRPGSLSPAAMETLAVIAYRQPVLKSEIERVRGVDVSGPLKGLLEKKLIKMLGRKDVPGRPMMYGTSREFLEAFNLKDLSGLPTLRELKELQEEMGETADIFEAAVGYAAESEPADTTQTSQGEIAATASPFFKGGQEGDFTAGEIPTDSPLEKGREVETSETAESGTSAIVEVDEIETGPAEAGGNEPVRDGED